MTSPQKAAVSRHEASSGTAWWTGRGELTVVEALPTAESIDSANRTTTATRPGSTRWDRRSPTCEHLRDPDRSGTDDDDEEDREDAQEHRKNDLHRNLLRLLLRPLTAPHAQLTRLLPEHPRDRDAEAIRLDESRDERLDLDDARAFRKIGERLRPRTPELDLLEYPGELGCQRPRRVVGHLRQAGIEAQAGLDADREHVQGVRSRALHRRLSLQARVVHEQIGQPVAEGRQQPEEDRALAGPGHEPDQQPEAAEPERAGRLQGQDAFQVPRRDVARQVQSPPQALWGTHGRDPGPDPAQTCEYGPPEPLARWALGQWDGVRDLERSAGELQGPGHAGCRRGR